MKKTSTRRWLFIIPLLLFGVMAFAQSSPYISQSRTHVVLANYTDDLSVFSTILNTTDQTVIDAAKDQLKANYEAMSGIAINDTELDDMLDTSVTNYNTWTALNNSMPTGATEQESYVLRSIISTMYYNMNHLPD